MNRLLSNMIYLVSSSQNDWGSVHPVVVHFPIVLLTLSPLFILLGMIFTKNTRVFYISALIILLLGTAGIFLSTSSGDSAAEPLQIASDTVETLSDHIELAEHARIIFCLLSFVFAGITIFFPVLIRRFSRTVYLTTVSIFLGFYIYALLVLFNAAHYGAKLVHHHKITSDLFTRQQSIIPPSQ